VLSILPVVVLAADAQRLQTIYNRAMGRGVRLSLYIDDIFETGYNAANSATVKTRQPDDMPIAGLPLRDEK
tara:strand:+ start:197 stop:409 length:213 start_codon:yes stop_codon:yes gene_type:complete